MCYDLSVPAPVGGQVSCVLLWSAFTQGAFSCNGEAAACGLLGVLLVHFGVFPLETGGVKAIGKNSGKPGDILSRAQFFHASAVHLLLDCVLQGFDFGGGFLGKCLPFFQGFDLGNDFCTGHCVYFLSVLVDCFVPLVYLQYIS